MQFRGWIGQLAIDRAIPESDIPQILGPKEVENRLNAYPMLGRVLAQDPVDMQQLEKVAKDCWALAEKFDIIRLNEFVGNPESGSAVRGLIVDFPQMIQRQLLGSTPL